MYVRALGRRTIFLHALLLLGFFLFPVLSRAADLTLSPSSASVSKGKTVSVQVMLEAGGESVNAADGTLSFDKSLVSVESISKEGSAFSLWTADPSFSNSEGTISFSGGTPSAFTSSKKVVTIVFKGVKEGSAAIAFTKGSILAADGKGTDVYKNGTGGTVVVSAAAEPPPEDTGDSTGDGATPISPIINSSTHPKPDTWYGTSTAAFAWALPDDATEVRTLISDKDNDTPKVSLKSATSSHVVTGIKDGVSYFYVQIKNNFGWGDVGKIKIQVDTTPPLDFNVALLQTGADGAPPKLTFKTDDQLSGMDRYEISIGTSTPIAVRAQDVSDGTYAVPPQGGGIRHVTIRAVDKAGNSTEASADLDLPLVEKPKPASATTDAVPVSNNGFGLLGAITAILLALIVGGLVTWNMYIRNTFKSEKAQLLQAVLEVRDKNDRIFSAIREEFEQLIQNLDPKPQLTPQERDFLEEVKEVLDISEELVDTSIEELKKMIRNQQ